MRNVSDKIVQKIATPSLSSITVSETRTAYEIMWKKNMAETTKSQMTI